MQPSVTVYRIYISYNDQIINYITKFWFKSEHLFTFHIMIRL